MKEGAVPAQAEGRQDASFLVANARTFPSVHLYLPAGGVRAKLDSRPVAGHSVVRVRTSALAFESDPVRARRAGLGGSV